MKTSELIHRLQTLDPIGDMDVVLAVDSGEGYVGLDTVFVDRMRRQPVDGDELDMSSNEEAMFLGDSNAEKSPPPVFRYESAAPFDPDVEQAVFTTFDNLGVEVGCSIDPRAEVQVYLNNNEDDLILRWVKQPAVAKFVSVPALTDLLKESLMKSANRIDGRDASGARASIVRIKPLP